MGKSLNLIKDELKDEVKEGSNYKIKRVVTLDSIEINKEVEVDVDHGVKRIDLIYSVNKLFFIASIIFAVYGLIAIFGLADRINGDDESANLLLLIIGISISLIFVDSAFGFFLGSLLRFRILKEEHYLSRKKYVRNYIIFMIVELIITFSIMTIGIIKIENSLFFALAVCPIVFGFVLSLIIALYIKPQTN